MTTETTAANALADEIARLRGVIQQKNHAIRELCADNMALWQIADWLHEAHPLTISPRELHTLHARHPGAALLEQIRRAASHLPGNPDAAAAVLSQLLGEG